MKKKITKTLIVILFLLAVMFAEYQYIIYNIHPYIGEINSDGGGEVYIEFLGKVDSYYAEPMSVLE